MAVEISVGVKVYESTVSALLLHLEQKPSCEITAGVLVLCIVFSISFSVSIGFVKPGGR